MTLAVFPIVCALVVASCSPQRAEPDLTTTTTLAPDTTTTTTTVVPVTSEPGPMHPYGGEAIVANSQEPPTLNGFLPGGSWSVVSIVGQGYAAGVREVSGDTLEYVPELVTELPTVANGGLVLNTDGTMTVKYTIRDEAVWSDGTPISGGDFQFTLDTILNEDLPIDRTNYDLVVSSSVGDKTFEFTLAVPTVNHERMFSEILPKHDIEGKDFVTDFNDVRWVSNGPFVLKEWAKGEYITLERNPNYWKVDEVTGQQLPYLDAITFRFFDGTQAIIDAFTARDVDIITPEPDNDDIVALRMLEPQGAAVEVLNGPYWEHLNFQFGSGRLDRNENSCNDNYDMRRAIALAIDKERLIAEALDGTVEPLSSYVDAFAPTLSQHAWDQYQYDPVAASDAYAAAVAAEEKECSVVFTANRDNPDRVRMSELFVDMFAEAGIPYENDLEDAEFFYGDTYSNASWDVSDWAWGAQPGLSRLIDFHDIFDPEGPPPGGDNAYNWGTPDSSVVDDATLRYAEVRDAMRTTIDDAELRGLIAEAEQILADNLVIIPLYASLEYLEAAAVWADEIGNFKHNPTSAGPTWNVEYWYRSDR